MLSAIIMAGGFATPAQTATPPLPDHLVNGDFEYRADEIIDTAKTAAGSAYLSDWNWANVDYLHGDAGAASKWAHVDGFDADVFAWKSSQTDASVDGRAPIVEIQHSKASSNTYGEITASQFDTYLYQDIDTSSSTPVVYYVHLKHASRTTWFRDSMRVLIGPPGHETPVRMTRTASTSGDALGVTDTLISSTPAAQDDGWDTYQASLTIPAGQDVTRFTFESVTNAGPNLGNCIDDVLFTKAYPLTYDLNGGNGKLPE